MKMKHTPAAIITVVLFMCGCAEVETKMQAYPKMYSETEKPISIVVVPVINKTTAADAGDLINSTLTVPFADNGYYVLPISIVSDIFKREGVIEGSQISGLPSSVFKANFGVDSVLYITINKWDTNYVVLAANVTVGMSYVLVSTSDNSVLWSYDQQVVVDTGGGSSGFILLDIIQTAVNTALTDYIPIARQVNATAVVTMPYGKYHPQVGQDGDMEVVLKSSREKAVEPSE
jgi:hypothetical protein